MRPAAPYLKMSLAACYAVSLFILGSPAPVHADCDCGPDFCQNDSRYLAKIAAKKKTLAQKGFSNDLIGLLDQDGHCLAAVEQAPDTFFIKRRLGGGWDTRDLNTEREKYAKDDVLSGVADAYYKFNTNHALACCGEPKYDKRSDWNSALDMNMRLVLVCRKDGSSVSCHPGQ